MKNNDFALAMNKIVGEHEAEQLEETRQIIRTERRSRIFGRVRFVFILLLLASLGVFAFNYRDQISKFCASKTTPGPEGKASVALDGARQAAATRDAVVNEVTK